MVIAILATVFFLVVLGLTTFSQAESTQDWAGEFAIFLVKVAAFFLVTFTMGMVLVLALV